MIVTVLSCPILRERSPKCLITNYNNLRDNISDLSTYSKSLIYGFSPSFSQILVFALGHLATEKKNNVCICIYTVKYVGISNLHALFYFSFACTKHNFKTDSQVFQEYRNQPATSFIGHRGYKELNPRHKHQQSNILLSAASIQAKRCWFFWPLMNLQLIPESSMNARNSLKLVFSIVKNV